MHSNRKSGGFISGKQAARLFDLHGYPYVQKIVVQPVTHLSGIV
jgi:hypothetical protein